MVNENNALLGGAFGQGAENKSDNGRRQRLTYWGTLNSPEWLYYFHFRERCAPVRVLQLCWVFLDLRDRSVPVGLEVALNELEAVLHPALPFEVCVLPGDPRLECPSD